MGAPGARARRGRSAVHDIPENVRWETPPDRRGLDVRTIVPGQFTPKDKFATTAALRPSGNRSGDVQAQDLRVW
jgi:hypothetical protein